MARGMKHFSSSTHSATDTSVCGWDGGQREYTPGWETTWSSWTPSKQEDLSPVSEGITINTPTWLDMEQKNVEYANKGAVFTPTSFASKIESAPQAFKCTSVADKTALDPIAADEITSWDSPEDESFLDGFKSLLSNTKNSDVIICSADPYPPIYAHWLMLNMRTDSFCTMYRYKEAGKDVLETVLGGRDLRRIIQYIYTGDYDIEVKDESPVWYLNSPESVLDVHAGVYSGAQRYHIRGLTNLCAKKFEKACNSNWNCDSFCRAIEKIYSIMSLEVSTKNDKMKEVVVQAAVDHGAELRENESFKYLLAQHTNGFAGDLVLKMFPKKREDSWKTGCAW